MQQQLVPCTKQHSVHRTAMHACSCQQTSCVAKCCCLGHGVPRCCRAVSDGLQHVFWSSASAAKGKAPRRLALHNNGNLAMYDADNNKLWETDTADMIHKWQTYGELMAK